MKIEKSLPYLIVAVAAILFTQPVFADTVATNITVDTTWTLANSPFVVADTISVFPGATLIIEPGVIVKFESEKKLQVAGTLVARGTKNNPIQFISNNPIEKWGGIAFLDGAVNASVDADYSYISGSAIEHAVIENSAWSCVDIHNTSPIIAHSDIRNCGIETQTSSTSAIIYSNIIHDNAHDIGIRIANNNGSLRIINNLIYGNGIGINMVNGNNGAIIRANAILNNETGLASESGNNYTIEYNTIDNSVTDNTSFAIYIVGGSNGKILNNFLNNDANYQPSNATILVASTNPLIQDNIITGSGDSVLRLNCACTNISLNNIRNTGAGYLVRATSVNNISALNNYWNTNDNGVIAAGIFDYNDDPTVGLVTFEPYLSSSLVFPPSAVLTALPTSPTNQSTAEITVGGNDIVSYKYKFDAGYYTEEQLVGTPISLTGLSDGSHTISVVGKDSSGAWQIMSNETATTYTWIVDSDTIPPVIELVGNSIVNFFVGDAFEDPGVIATDDNDGDITSHVLIGGDLVNTAVAGTYIVIYNVSDNAGNAADEVTRTIVVSSPLDVEPPHITITEPQIRDYLRSELLPIDVAAIDIESGVNSLETKLDNILIPNVSTVDLFYKTLGTHTLVASSSDNAGNATTSVNTFRVVANASSTLSDIERAYTLGWMTRSVRDSIIKKFKSCYDVKKTITVVKKTIIVTGRNDKPITKKVQEKIEKVEIIFNRRTANELLKLLDKKRGKGLNDSAYNLIREDIMWLINN